MQDEALLQAYRSRGCEDSFSELVRRHVSLVYGTARRQVKDPHVAEEICQSTFCALAKNAGSIRQPGQLAGWLYRTTRRLAALHFRQEERRARRETIAAVNLGTMQPTESWNEIEPLLDQALDNLSEADRLAVLLRFFGGNSMAEVATRLGVSEAAAKMRVGRAVEKLRGFFASCGITCSVAALSALLEQNAVVTVPPAITAAILTRMGKLKVAVNAPAGTPSTAATGFKLAFAAAVIGLAIMALGSRLPGFRRAPGPEANSWKRATSPASAADVTPSGPPPDPGQPAAPLGTTIRLTVLDAATSRPLTGVRVSAQKAMGDRITDENGVCELPLPLLAAADFYFRLTARSEGFVTTEASWSRFQRDEPADVPSEYVLKMTRGIRVGGTLLDDDGNPAPGTQIELTGYSTTGGPPPRERAWLHDGGTETAVTDATGHWVFNRLPPEWGHVHFRVRDPRFLPADFVSDANDEGGIGQAKVPQTDFLGLRAALRLRRGLHLLGEVLDENGQPIAGARVVQNREWNTPSARVTTRNDGVYEFLNASTGSLTLSVQTDHYAPLTTTIEVGGPQTNAPIILAAGHRLRGRVIDENGAGVAGAEVEVDRGPDGRGDIAWSIKTDAEGRFSWDGAPSQPLGYTLWKPGFKLTKAVLSANGSEQLATLARNREATGIRVQGNVVDDESNLPLERFQIVVAEAGQPFGAPREGADGHFSIRLMDDERGAAIEVRAEGHAPARIEAVSNSDGDKDLTFRLRAAAVWNGQVLLPNGANAAGAEVALSSLSRSPHLGDRRLLFKDSCINQVTDAMGRFHFDADEESKLVVVVHAEGYAERDVAQLGANPVLRLQPWGRVEGVLRSAGRALANEKVYLQKRFWNPWTPSIQLYFEPFTATTDANGGFSLDSVPPGELALSHLIMGRSIETRTTAQVKPGETTLVQVGGQGRPVRGRIVVPGRESGFDYSNSGGVLNRRQSRPIDLPRTVRRANFADDESYQEAARKEAITLTRYWQSDEGLVAWREHRSYTVWYEADGTFHADDIPAGEYELTILLRGPGKGTDVDSMPKTLGFYSGSVTVPDNDTVDNSEVVISGTVMMHSKF